MVEREAWRVERERGAEPALPPELVRKVKQAHTLGSTLGRVLAGAFLLTFLGVACKLLAILWNWILSPL